MVNKIKKPRPNNLQTNKRSKSTKGVLIKGMSRRLPSIILENEVFRRRLREIMKGYSGIYALYKGPKVYYVGLATNLFGRIKWHLKDRHRGKWDYFIIFRIKRVKFLKDIETLLTHLIDTKGNKQKGKVPKDADINRVLKDILKEHKKEIKGIEKVISK